MSVRISVRRDHGDTMIPEIIETPLIKAVRASIGFIKYLAVFVAALAFPTVLLDADLTGKFIVLVPIFALLLVARNYGKSVLF